MTAPFGDSIIKHTDFPQEIDPSAYRFSLDVRQQPIRSRMCGLGDKDRRLISPPPCVQLIPYLATTGAPLANVNELDVSFFALTIELWSVDESTNLSIASSQTRGPGDPLLPPLADLHRPDPASSSLAHPAAAASSASGIPASPPLTSSLGRPSNSSYSPIPSSLSAPVTRNLIGTLVATASKLYDLEDQLGIWFVFHDLSIRVEGDYKLKFSFVRLNASVTPNTTSPILCTAFSQPFRSYSAKKFPGVIEATELSRCFALQGVRIPIRKQPKMERAEESSSHDRPATNK